MPWFNRGSASDNEPKVTASLQSGNTVLVNLEAQVEAPPDVMFSLLADPTQHERIFNAIEGASSTLLEEEGPRRRYRLDYKARWRFWRVSGVCDNRLIMETDADEGTVSFRLREPGFLRVYEGCWRICPRDAPALNLHSQAAASSVTASRTSSPQLSPAISSAASSASSLSSAPSALGLSGTGPADSASADTSSLAPQLSSAPSLGSALSFPSLISGPMPFMSGLFKGVKFPGQSWFSAASTTTTPASAAGLAEGPQRSGPSIAALLASIHNPVLQSLKERAGLSAPPSAAVTPELVSPAVSPSNSAPPSPSVSRRPSLSLPAPEAPAPATLPPAGFKGPCVITAQVRMSPKVSPPSPLGGLLKGQAVDQVNEMLEGLVKATIAAANGADLPLDKVRGIKKGRQGIDTQVEPLRLEAGPRSTSSNGVPAAYGASSLKSKRSIASHNILTAASISLSDDDDL